VTDGDKLNLLIGLLAFGLVLLLWPEKDHTSQQKAATKDKRAHSWQYEPTYLIFFRKYKNWYPDENRHKAEERKYWRRQNGISIFTLISAVGAGLIAFGAFQETRKQADEMVQSNKISRNTLIASNRAWLNPTHFEFIKPIDADDGPVVSALLQNVGRFPALDNKSTMVLFGVPLQAPIDGKPYDSTWDQMGKTIRDACAMMASVPDGPSVFPSSISDTNMIAKPPLDKIKIDAGEHLLLIMGCLAYSTFNEPHHTGFCRFASKARAGQWELLVCPVGNFAE
jgi:hypothetical protein